jgi:release factor glutamine methyltransferase
MESKELFNRTILEWRGRFNLLADKPEESLESTVAALWLKAAGFTVSAAKAPGLPLPELTEAQEKELYRLLQLRVENKPLAHITGRQNFMGIEFVADRRALIPRKETEILGEKALKLSESMIIPGKTIYVMDVCCGSGNLGISVAFHNTHCVVYSSDISQEAVDLARENAERLNLDNRVIIEQGDLMAAFREGEFYEKFDLIICNPPYITSSKVSKMELEISMNEPVEAFDGGMLGTRIIQRLIREAPEFLRKDGWLAFEVGAGQGPLISQLCERSLLYNKIETVTDPSGQIRVLVTRK